MTYYKDFTECDYCCNYDFACRLMAVGWVEQGFSFEKGLVPNNFLEVLRALREGFDNKWLHGTVFRGLHNCSLCGELLYGSHLNLYIPHRGFMFVAPGGIDHYIEVHGYSPPESFIEAVYRCPDPSSPNYRKAVRASNRGYDAPYLFEGSR